MTYASNAALGYGTLVKFEVTDGAGDYTEIEEFKDMPESGGESALVEVTHQSSASKRKEYIAGFEDPEEQTLEFNWIRSAVQEAVRAAKGTTRGFQRYFPATDHAAALTQTGRAVILSAKVTAPVQGERKLMVKLKWTGVITEA